MNLTQLILKQAQIFPTIKKDQLYRLVNSYQHTSQMKFDIEFSFLVRKNIIKIGYKKNEVVYSI